MSRSFLRQDTQIRNTDVYNDLVASGSLMESASATGEDDLNNLRSQVKRLLYYTNVGNWYDDVPTINSKTRGLFQLGVEVDDLEEKKFLCRANVLTPTPVPPAQNWVILSLAGGETPTQTAATLSTTDGAVVSQSGLNGVGFNVAEPALQWAGPDALHPKNLCIVLDAVTGGKLESNGKDIFGLLQYESTGADGGAFNDVSGGARVKLTFVIANAARNGLEVCPQVDIAGKTIQYSYVLRIKFDNFPEDCFLTDSGFVDMSGAVDVTRKNAYDNQGVAPVELSSSAFLDIGGGFGWTLRDVTNAPLFGVTEGSGGSNTTVQVSVDVDFFDVDALDNNFNSGVKVSSSTNPIDLGVTPGLITTLSALDLTVKGSGELFLNDGNFDAEATWAQAGVKVTETAAEVAAYEATFGGEVSLFNALVQANNSASRNKGSAVVTVANVPAGTNLTSGTNLDSTLPDYSAVVATFATSVDTFVNGQLLRGDNSLTGANSMDCYPGLDPSIGDIKFEFPVRGLGATPDVITMTVYGG